MEFLIKLLETILSMIVIAVFAFAGIMLGRYLRKKKDEKDEK